MKKIVDEELLRLYVADNNMLDYLDEELLSLTEIWRYDKGETILEAGNPLTYYYFFVKGKIKVYSLQENGKALLHRFYTGFDTLGDVELFSGSVVKCNVQTVEETDLIVVPAAVFREKNRNNAVFLHYVIRSLTTKMAESSSNSSYNLTYPLINRLSSYILEHGDQQGRVTLADALGDIAEYLGTTYRHLHRTFRELVAEGVIAYEGKTIAILNKEKLQELAKNVYRS